MTSKQIEMLIPVVLYLGFCVFLALRVGNRQMAVDSGEKKHRFSKNYFIGGRSLGGFVLAMTTMATYYEASSYFGGPGIAYSQGLSWVYLAMIQTPLTFLILGTFGKKMNIVSRKINAVTIPDYLRHRFHSETLVWVAVIGMIVFFESIMVAQLMGGSILLSAITGIPYLTGLVIFTVVIVIYTAIGGFKAVAIGDAVQGMVMLAGALVLLVCVVKAGGGMWSIKESLDQVMPYWADAAHEGQSKLYTMCFWMLVGYACVGLPQTAVRNMSFKSTKSLHSAMIVSTIVLGFIMLVTHFCGGLSRAFITPDMVPTSDSVVPLVATMYMPSVLCGLFVAGCMAAVMSTIAGVLVNCVSSAVKDIWLHNKEKRDPNFLNNPKNEKRYKTLTMAGTLVFALIAFVIAIDPPSLISYLNLFATGGLESVFLMPIIGGLYYKKGNKVGALASAIGGFVTFLLCKTVIPLGDVDASVPAVLVAVLLFFLGSALAKPDLSAKEMEVYFPTV